MKRLIVSLATIVIACSADLLSAQTHIGIVKLDNQGVSVLEANALTDRLRTEMFQTGKYRVVERELMETVYQEQNFQLAGCTSDACLIEVGQVLGVRQIVGGSVCRLGETYSVSCRIIDVETSEILSVATLDFDGEIDELLRTGMQVVALRLTGEDAKMRRIKRRKPTPPDVIHHPWQTLMTFESNRNLEGNLSDDYGTTLFYTTRFLPRIWCNQPFTLRPAATFGILYQQITDPPVSRDFSSWQQDVYLILPELYLGYELYDFSFTLFSGIGPGYYDYKGLRKYEYHETSNQGFGVSFTAGMQLSVPVLFVNMVGQVRFIHTPGIKNNLLMPSVGIQTKSTFWAILPWLLVVIPLTGKYRPPWSALFPISGDILVRGVLLFSVGATESRIAALPVTPHSPIHTLPIYCNTQWLSYFINDENRMKFLFNRFRKEKIMASIYEDNSLSIGRTPLVKISKIASDTHVKNIYGKVEGRNPAYSVKCRIGASMIWDAEERGELDEDTIVIEPTSGNTGIALSYVCAARGYKLILTMPETLNEERRKMMRAFGADLILTDGDKGMKGAIARDRKSVV